jgi:hypothetical protein
LAAVALAVLGVRAAETGWIIPYLLVIGVALAEQGIAWLVRKRR